MNPYFGVSETFLIADSVRMETVREQFEAFKAAIVKMRERVVLKETEERLDDLLNGLIDLDGNSIDPTITLLEEAIGMFEQRREREHEKLHAAE